MGEEFTLISPAEGHIVAEPIEQARESEGGISLPAGYEDEGPPRAKVLAVGPGRQVAWGVVGVRIEVGDVVVAKPPWVVLEINKKKYVILDVRNVIATINEDEVRKNSPRLVKPSVVN
jgi:co-chaperonin GroES (HSP10)